LGKGKTRIKTIRELVHTPRDISKMVANIR